MKCDYCERDSSECRIKKVQGKHYCPKHLTRFYRSQDMDAKSIYDANDILMDGAVARIVLRDKHGTPVGEALVDAEDAERCKLLKWHVKKGNGNTNYAIAHLPEGKTIFLHRYVLEYNGSQDIDHVNRNGLDNRKENLRVVTHAVNTANNGKCGIKKVPSGKFQASCCRNYKTIYIGTYNTFDEAVTARADFIKKLDS